MNDYQIGAAHGVPALEVAQLVAGITGDQDEPVVEIGTRVPLAHQRRGVPSVVDSGLGSHSDGISVRVHILLVDAVPRFGGLIPTRAHSPQGDYAVAAALSLIEIEIERCALNHVTGRNG